MSVPREQLPFAAAPSISARTRLYHVPYCAAWMLNQLRRGHRAWPMFKLKSGAAMAAPAAPMPLPLVCHDMMICCDIRISITFVTAWKKQYHDFLKRCPWVMNLSGSSNWEWAYFQEFQISLVCCHWHCYSCCPLPTNNTDSNKLVIFFSVALYYDDTLYNSIWRLMYQEVVTCISTVALLPSSTTATVAWSMSSSICTASKDSCRMRLPAQYSGLWQVRLHSDPMTTLLKLFVTSLFGKYLQWHLSLYYSSIVVEQQVSHTYFLGIWHHNKLSC